MNGHNSWDNLHAAWAAWAAWADNPSEDLGRALMFPHINTVMDRPDTTRAAENSTHGGDCFF